MMTITHEAATPIRSTPVKRVGTPRASRKPSTAKPKSAGTVRIKRAYEPPSASRKPSAAKPKSAGTVRIKRAYEPPSKADGYRVLVDRLWPRGTKKDELALDDWLKEIAPSDALRRWFAHDPAHFAEFSRRYRVELQGPEVARVLDSLAQRASAEPLTLVYGARDPQNNHALVLQDEIARRIRPRSRKTSPTRRRA